MSNFVAINAMLLFGRLSDTFDACCAALNVHEIYILYQSLPINQHLLYIDTCMIYFITKIKKCHDNGNDLKQMLYAHKSFA